MKILLVYNYYPMLGGGEDSVVEREMSMLREKGHEIVPFFSHSRERGKADLVRAAFSLLWNPVAYGRIRKVICDEKPDLVHCHNTFPGMSPSIYWACKKEGVPVLHTLHNYRFICANALLLRKGAACEDCIRRGFPWPAVIHRCYRGSLPGSILVSMLIGIHRRIGTWRKAIDGYIVLSDFQRKKMIAGGIPAEKIWVKPHFVQMPSVSIERPEGGAASSVLFVGRLFPEKGCDMLLKAWAHLVEEIEQGPCILSIVGDGIERDSLMQLAEELNISASVRFLGFQSGEVVAGLMAQAAVHVFPSYAYETFGLTVIEAGLVGTPSIVSSVSVAASVVDEGRTGLLFKTGDPVDLANKLALALSDPSLMAMMGRQAQLDFSEKYSVESNYQCLSEIYSTFCAVGSEAAKA